MRAFVTGGAGFIGSHLVDRLVAEGHDVVVYDNFSTGKASNLVWYLSEMEVIKGSLWDLPWLTKNMKGCDIVFHLAANADVRHGLEDPTKDFENNTVGTFNVLEAMRVNGVKRIVFTSTGSVYGESSVRPTPENAPFPVQTSLYAASKLAGEGLIQAYSEGYGFQSYILRLVGVLGERYSHGHVVDFVRQLTEHPDKLFVRGNGFQCKSYIYVGDVIEAMMTAVKEAALTVNILNVGTDEFCTVLDSIRWIIDYLRLNPQVIVEQNERGWVGDNPFIYLDCSYLRHLGWKPTLTIKESVLRTLDYLTKEGSRVSASS